MGSLGIVSRFWYGHAADEFVFSDPQPTNDAHVCEDGHVVLTALDKPHIGAVNSHLMRERLLAEACAASQLLEALAQ
jgi:hypothetical protein